MRRLTLACLLTSATALSCSAGSGFDPVDKPSGEAAEEISWGSPDGTAHTAVVALLMPGSGGTFSECSGSIVQYKNGKAYVLTAAHCCVDGAPAVVTNNSDYSSAEGALFGYGLSQGVYYVDSGSAYYHSQFSMNDIGGGHDFCMLTYSPSSAPPVLALPDPTNDLIGSGSVIEHVGYGMTNTNQQNTLRNHGTDSITQIDNYADILLYAQGGSTPGTCEGDSGGPALYPAGKAQSLQKVVGVTSFGGADQYGNAIPCGQPDTGGADRVIAELGANGFITNFLNDAPTGTPAGTASTSSSSSGGTACDTCQQQAQSGTCSSAAQACGGDPKCTGLAQCYGNCTTQSCYTTCETNAGSAAVTELQNFVSCICNTACPSECQTECGGGSSSGGCGFTTGDQTCDTCLEGKCCAQSQACANDATCKSCATSQNPPASCDSNAKLNAFYGCLQNSCASPCGISTSSSSSGGTSSGGTSSGGTSSSSGGTSSGGTSSGGASSGGTGGSGGSGNVDEKSGCSVGATGTGTGTASQAAFGGLLLGLGLALSRRRRRS